MNTIEEKIKIIEGYTLITPLYPEVSCKKLFKTSSKACKYARTELGLLPTHYYVVKLKECERF